MDNDETFDETPDEVVAPQAPDPTDFIQQAKYWEDRAHKAEKQAVERKVALGRFETATKHGIPADLIPEWVPLDKMDEFAEKFAKAAASPATSPTEQVEAVVVPETGPTETEKNLAAVAKGPSSTGTAGGYTPEEALQLAMNDPKRYSELRDAGVISLAKLPGNQTRR